MRYAKFAVSLFCFASSLAAASPFAFVPQELKCDGQGFAVGVDRKTPSLQWTLRATDPNARNLLQSAYQVLVASSPAVLARDEGDLWDSGRVPDGRVYGIEYRGKELRSHTSYFWKVRVWAAPGDGSGSPSEWSAGDSFTTALLNPADWKAHWIAAEPDGPPSVQARENVAVSAAASKPMPIFRHAFPLDKQVKQALLFISGMGHYEARVNGRAVTEAVLTPGWTDYRKRVLYNTYDVTPLLRSGENTLVVLLGNGMYNVEGVKGRYTKFVGSFGQPKLIAQLHIQFADGSEAEIASSKDWKTTAGPIVFSSTFGGEDYDARREPIQWTPALEVSGPGGKLTSERVTPMKCIERLNPVKVSEPRPGTFVYDLGRNFSGWPAITVRGEAGSQVKLICGELLDAQGLVSQASAHAFPDSQNSFTYTLKGAGGEERWHPRFSYYGFRYVQVDNPPHVFSLEGEVIHDDVSIAGTFFASKPLFNDIHKLIDGAILSNMASVLTDCPHREKLGWLEQTYLAGTSILFNFDAGSLYRKMGDDIADAQKPDGLVPSIAPEFVAFVDKTGKSTAFRDSPEWGSAVVLSAWTAYRMSGDLTTLKEHYSSMKAYVDYLGARAKDGMLSYGLGDWYDIGPGEPGPSKLTGKALTATATYYQDLVALEQIASILGKGKDATALHAKAATVKDSFNRQLFHPDTNQYDRGSQTANAMPLALDMVPEDRRAAVLANLVADIRKQDNHVTAGDVGFHYVVRALTDNGQSAVLYDMLSRTDPPSYGDQLLHGATTLTEAWDANPNSSQNHFMLGHAEEWFYRGLAGIRIDMAAADPDHRIEIEPAPVGDVREASASYRSAFGNVESHWEKNGSDLLLDVVIPPGARATVGLPHEEHVIGSGKYRFTTR